MTENLFHLTNSGRVAEVQREKGTCGGFFCSRPVILKSHLCSRSWFMQSGRADPHSRAPTSTILSKENKIKYRPPSFPAALKTRKQTPTYLCVYSADALHSTHSPGHVGCLCSDIHSGSASGTVLVWEIQASSTTALAVLDAASYPCPLTLLTDLLLWWEKPSLKYWTPCYLSWCLLCAGISWCVLKQTR